MILRFVGVMLFVLVSSPTAFAAMGTEEAVSPNYKDPYDLVGLCTAARGNDKTHYWKSGHCKTIYETITKNECVSKKIEEIRLRLIGDDKDMKAAKLKVTSKVQLPVCDPKGGFNEKQNLEVLAKDKNQFALYMMQLFSLITIEQSNWRVLNNGNASQSQSVKCSDNCGLLGLSLEKMKDKKYACGCESENKTDDQMQFDATMDGHLNLRCGITMALIDATETKKGEEDDQLDLLGGGDPKSVKPGKEKDSRSGFAKIFKSLESGQNESKGKIDTPQKRIEAKMKTYCQEEAYNKRSTDEIQKGVSEGEGLNAIGMPKSDTNGRTTR